MYAKLVNRFGCKDRSSRSRRRGDAKQDRGRSGAAHPHRRADGRYSKPFVRRFVSRGTGFRMVVACLAVPIERMCVNFVLDHTGLSSAHKIQVVGAPSHRRWEGQGTEQEQAVSVCVGFGHHPRCLSATTRLECEVSEELS